MARIFPSLISANLLNLEQEIKTLEPYVDGFHIDIMDNHFVPNLTWGPDIANAIAHVTNKQLWVHLMVENPLSIIKKLILKKNSMLTFHFESKREIKKITTSIIEKNWLPGIAIKPKTDPKQINQFLQYIDHILPMSVEPGFSGQQFLSKTIDVIKEITRYKKENNLSFKIVGDGGINAQNIKTLYNLGIKDFAIASAIFSHDDPVQAIRELKQEL